MLNKSIIIMKVKSFIKSCDISTIKYDWDGGHSYSYIKAPIVDELYKANKDKIISDDEYDELTDELSEWMSRYEERPACRMHVTYDKYGKIISTHSSCGCHDHWCPETELEEIEDAISELKSLQESMSIKGLFTMEVV